jgi:hypothetical protein
MRETRVNSFDGAVGGKVCHEEKIKGGGGGK